MLGTLTAVLLIIAVAKWLRSREHARAEWIALPATPIAEAADGTRVKIVGRVEAVDLAGGALRVRDASGEALVRLRRGDVPFVGDRVAIVGVVRLEPDPVQTTYREVTLRVVVRRVATLVVVGR